MPYDPKLHHRRSVRLAGYDYTRCGAYFVTLNAWEHKPIFSEVIDGAVHLSSIGEIICRHWLKLAELFPVDLDAWVIMPDHLHGILVLRGTGEASGDSSIGQVKDNLPDASPLRPRGTDPSSLGAIIQNFKSITTRKINQQRGLPGGKVWHRNYYEHIVRNEADLDRIRRYIDGNPIRWSQGYRDP